MAMQDYLCQAKPQGIIKVVHMSRFYQANAVSDLGFLKGRGFNIEKMVSSYRLQVRQALYRNNGCSHSSPHPKAAQLSLPCYVSGACQVADPSNRDQVRVCKRVSVCVMFL